MSQRGSFIHEYLVPRKGIWRPVLVYFRMSLFSLAQQVFLDLKDANLHLSIKPLQEIFELLFLVFSILCFGLYCPNTNHLVFPAMAQSSMLLPYL